MKRKTLKKVITIALAVISLGLLAGCFPTDVGTLVLNAPESSYPGREVTLTAVGVVGGQFTFNVEGKTVTGTSTEYRFSPSSLPCDVAVMWDGGGVPQTATKTIYLENEGPVIGLPLLDGKRDNWTIQPKARVVVTFPDAYDPEGGPVTLIYATVYHTGQEAYQAVFCPPYVGDGTAKPSLYRVRTGQGDLFNAFVFHSIWEEILDKETCGWNLPITPPSKTEDGYPGGRGATCPPLWPREDIPAGMTIITATFVDEVGASTTESWSIPTTWYYGC